MSFIFKLNFIFSIIFYIPIFIFFFFTFLNINNNIFIYVVMIIIKKLYVLKLINLKKVPNYTYIYTYFSFYI